jgi:hypothetical protein
MSTLIQITKPTELIVNNTPIVGGVAGRVLFEGTGNVLQQSGNLFWNNTNGRLGIGTSTPSSQIDVFASNPIISTRIATDGIGKFNYLNGAGTAEYAGIYLNANSGEMRMFTNTTYFPTFYSSNAERMRIPTTGNVLINTTTDAGFLLDVNGTARVQGNLTLGGEIFGATNTYFNGPTINTGTLWLRFAGVNSSNNFTATGTVQGNNILANSGNAEVKALGTSIPSLIVQNTTTSATWRIESHRTTSGALEFKNDITNPVLNLFSTRNVGIGTFTDAGFRLDVNGTARVQGVLSTTSDASFNGVVIGRAGGNNNSNTGVGLEILQSNSTGTGNTGVGQSALRNNTTGSGNTAVGQNALRINTTSGENTAIGNQSMQNNTGNRNTAIGVNTLNANIGTENTALGRITLQANTSGNFNTGIGSTSLSGNTTGSGNSALGYNTQSGNFSNSVILGHSATATANNQFVVGSTGVNAGAVVTETNTSTKYWEVVINGVTQKVLLA